MKEACQTEVKNLEEELARIKVRGLAGLLLHY